MLTKRWMIVATVLAALAGSTSDIGAAVAEPVGDLGIAGIECDCTFAAAQDRWVFRSHPRVVAMSPWATAGLRAGDQILSIDGYALTSREGGERFAHLEPGSEVELEVQRDGRARSLRVEVHGVSATDALTQRAPRAPRAENGAHRNAAPPMPEMPAAPAPMWREVGTAPRIAGEVPGAPSAPPAPRAAGRPALAPRAPDPSPTPREILPEGWFGFAIECFPCSGGRVEGVDHPVWEFGKPPHVYNIAPGSPAARAGLQRGDALTHMDGVSLTTRAGGERFGAVKPGATVEWRVRRGRENLTMRMIAESREPVRAAASGPPRAPRAPQTLRYAARFGDNDIEVRGSSAVIISEDDDKGEIVITSDGVTVRVRKRTK